MVETSSEADKGSGYLLSSFCASPRPSAVAGAGGGGEGEGENGGSLRDDGDDRGPLSFSPPHWSVTQPGVHKLLVVFHPDNELYPVQSKEVSVTGTSRKHTPK